MSSIVLSIVLPIRCARGGEYLLDRLAANLALFDQYGVECVVIDSASAPRHAARIRRLCEGHPRRRLVVDPDPQEPFAPGSTRNAGARHASGEHLVFYDVDLCCGPDFVPAVARWALEPRDPRDFLVVPCLFLTQAATAELRFSGSPVNLDRYRAALFDGDDRLVSHFSGATVVASKEHFLRLGGNRPEYRGHGCEDFDLIHRLCSYRPIGKRPADYYLDVKRCLPGDYQGFRAYFALHALPHLFAGLYTAHLWHARPLHRPYYRRRQTNEALLQDLMRRHDAGEAAPPDLPAPWSDEGDDPAPDVREMIRTLATRHGHAAARPLLQARDDEEPHHAGTPVSKLRKLALRPRDFLADSRFASLRALGRVLPPKRGS